MDLNNQRDQTVQESYSKKDKEKHLSGFSIIGIKGVFKVLECCSNRRVRCVKFYRGY